MLADRGFLRRVGGTWLDRTEQLPLPESVQAIIAARLDALAADDKALLADAAVLGKVAWVGALAALAGAQASALEQRLHTLERRELLRRERRSAVAGERQYAFRHVLVRDVAYQQLPRAARADRHRRAAEWLEALSPDRVEDRAELLAHHWQAALDFTRAAGQDTTELVQRARLAQRDAGDRALALNAFHAAARWYTAALELWPTDDPERPRLLFRLGRSRLWVEDAGVEQLEAARDGLLAQGDWETAAEAEVMLGVLASRQGQGAQADEHLWRALALLQDAGPSEAKARALANVANSLVASGEASEAIRVGRQALAMADALGLDHLRAQALGNIGFARVSDGDPDGVADAEEAVAVAVAANLPHSSFAYSMLSMAVIEFGDLARGFQLQAKAREIAERLGIVGEVDAERIERAFADYWRGRWDAALHEADRFIADSQSGSPHFDEPFCRFLRGWIRLARGDVPGALEDATTGLQVGPAANNRLPTLALLGLHARALLAVGDAEQASAKATELLGMAQTGALFAGLYWSRELAIALRTLGRGTELLELLATAKATTPWLQAAAAIATGDFERAAELYAEIGSRPDEALARLHAAEQLLASGRQAEGNTQLHQALGFHRQVQASAYVRQAEALLAASA